MGGVLDSVGGAGYFVATLGANLFIILYAVLARFWKSKSGWHIFSFMMSITLLMNHGVASIFFPEYPGREWVRASLFPVLAVVIWWRVLILVSVQIQKRKEPYRGDLESVSSAMDD